MTQINQKRKRFSNLAGASPDEYIGRMNTPPANSINNQKKNMDSHHYIGRMDTPPALNKQYFCPYCGTKFTDTMKNLLKQKVIFYCEFCGEKIDSLLFL